jgi:asparagine synthase (glutamine-hydrolysing)
MGHGEIMCGIAGLIGCGDADILGRMTDSLVHRGPDDRGVEWFVDSNSGVGNRRLAIIDLSPAGHQPMSNAAGNLWITHNGEIYNFREVRKELIWAGYQFKSQSDTEVIVKAYEAWGEKCLVKFNGMFAFAIYDSQRHRLFAARDRLGIKPFYYSWKDGSLVFASEVKAILTSSLVERKPDYYALCTPTRFQIPPYTGFENILKLPPAHYLVFEAGSLSIKQYWEIGASEDAQVQEHDATERLDALLNDAVALQMIADVPVGVFLSGGLDSSLISALMRKNTGQEIRSFTIRFSEADQKFEKMSDDSQYAREVASRFGFRHHEIEVHPDIKDLLPKLVWHLDEPLADPAAINTYLISKSAYEKGIIVLLNGMGGDEIFGGYRKYLACLKADTFQALVPGVFRRVINNVVEALPVATSRQGLRTLRWSKRFLSFASLPQVRRFLASDQALSKEVYTSAFVRGVPYEETHFFRSQVSGFHNDGLSYLTKMCLNDTKVFLPEHNLLYSDKASMAASVEGRPPLTDHRIVEYMFSLPPPFRIKGNVQKYLLKKVAQRYLPRAVAYRPKASFGTPLRSWIRGPLSEMVEDLLCEQSLKARGLYDPPYVSELIERDRKGMDDNALTIWMLLTTEVWFRTFFAS